MTIAALTLFVAAEPRLPCPFHGNLTVTGHPFGANQLVVPLDLRIVAAASDVDAVLTPQFRALCAAERPGDAACTNSALASLHRAISVVCGEASEQTVGI